MPSVAMNEFTWKRTMIMPDRKPTAAQATSATRHEMMPLRSVFASIQLTMTSEKASMAPTERSKAPAVSGMSSARARMPMTT